MNLLEETVAGTEAERQQEFRNKLKAKITELKAKLMSKTPRAGVPPSGGVVQQSHGGTARRSSAGWSSSLEK